MTVSQVDSQPKGNEDSYSDCAHLSEELQSQVDSQPKGNEDHAFQINQNNALAVPSGLTAERQ